MNEKHAENVTADKTYRRKLITLTGLNQEQLPDAFHSLSGKLHFKMTNDMLFRIVFEANPKALKGLICSLLHLNENDVRSVEVTNPIELGSHIDAKAFVLDLKILMNNEVIINLEMQVLKEPYWRERSLSYLCRAFSNLNKGDSYADVKSVIHIGILDFDLFPEYPEFYASYYLKNEKNNITYSSKIKISVLNLNHTNIATDEDITYKINQWAKFFKATTWEEVNMLAQENEAIFEAAKTIYFATENERLRQLCEDREEYERRQRTIEAEFKRQEAEFKRQEAELAKRDAEIADKNAEIADKNAEIADKNDENAKLTAEIERLRAELAALKKQ